MRTPEQAVVDEIDALVDWQLTQEPSNALRKIQMTVTVEMTEQQMRDWAEDYDKPIEEVAADVRSYVLNDLLVCSRAREDYWTDVSVGPA